MSQDYKIWMRHPEVGIEKWTQIFNTICEGRHNEDEAIQRVVEHGIKGAEYAIIPDDETPHLSEKGKDVFQFLAEGFEPSLATDFLIHLIDEMDAESTVTFSNTVRDKVNFVLGTLARME